MSLEQARASARAYLRARAPRAVADSDFTPTVYTDAVEKYLPSVIRGYFLALAGPVDGGKTYAAYYALGLYRSLTGRSGMVLTSREVVDWSINAKGDLERAIQDSRLLVIDDIGAEHKGATAWGQSVMEAVIDYRSLHRLPTIITTNLTKTAFGETFGERSLSRVDGWGWYLQSTRDKAPRMRVKPEPEPAAYDDLPAYDAPPVDPEAGKDFRRQVEDAGGIKELLKGIGKGVEQ